MINIIEVANKLSAILNGTDSETSGYTNPTPYEYMVATEGFHLDFISNKKTGLNFIPVFVSSMGGSFNPVPDLKQATFTVPLVFYYPVRFKDDFFVLWDFLASCFVGQNLTYGTNKKAISNISVPVFGEIVDLDLKQFKTWTANIYQKEVDVNEPWMSMTVTLYLTSSAANFVYGNDVAVTLSIDGQTALGTESVVFAQSTVMSQAQSLNEQALGSNESHGFPFGTTYGSSFACYYKDNAFYRYLVEQWFSGNAQTLRFTLTLKIGQDKVVNGNTITAPTFTRTCYLESVNLAIRKGELLTLTFGFAKAGDSNA